MRVGVVTPRYPPHIKGGGEISAKLLVDELTNRDEITNVTVYSLDSGYPSQVDNVSVRRFSTPTNVLEVSNTIAAYQLSSQLDDIDILHAYNMDLNPAVGYLSAQSDTPSVATLNSYTFLSDSMTKVSPDSKLKAFYKKYWLPTIGRLLTEQFKKIDRFFALSDTVKQAYSSNLLDSSQISVIPNMIDPSFEKSLTIESGYSNSDNIRLLYVGSLVKEKGVEYLIKSLTNLSGKFNLSIAGTGPKKQTLQRLSTVLEVESQVRFHGHLDQDQLGKLYSEADVFVHPGIWREPFGRTILEAMQAKLPIVCTDVGAPQRLVSGKKNICNVADPTDLAKAIKFASKNRYRLGNNNHKEKNKYLPKNIVSDIINEYIEVISNHQGSLDNSNKNMAVVNTPNEK